MKIQNYFFACLVVFLTTGWTANAWSAMEFHPRIIASEEYNDNIYLDDRDEEDDWITTVSPGFNLSYSGRSVDASIDYSLRYLFYKYNDEENIDKFEDVQRADASAFFFEGRPFTLNLSQKITREALDTRDNNTDYNDLVNRSTVYRTIVTPEYRLPLSPVMTSLFGYTYRLVDFTETSGDDYQEHRGYLSLIRALSAKTDVYGRFAYTDHLADVDFDDFNRFDYILGTNWQVSSKTTLLMEGGYSTIEYDQGLDEDIVSWLMDLSYRLADTVSLSLSYIRDFEVSASDGVTENQKASVSGNYGKDLVQASAELYWLNEDYLQDRRQDESYGVRLALSRQLARALTAKFDTLYEMAVYDDIGGSEDVDIFSIGTALSYEYRRLSASLGYRYRIKDSEVDNNDYENNVVTLTGALRF